METTSATHARRISCKRCQKRKIKCTRTYPCSSCSAANVRCEFREDDFKRPPVSREYIAALESRVATLEAVIGRLKRASYEERDEILEGVTIQEHTQPFAPETAADTDGDEIALSDAIRKATLHETDEGALAYHGPTSIFNSNLIEPPSTIVSSAVSSPFSNSISALHTPTIRRCIGLFFRWQYEQFIFIDREYFLQMFEEGSTGTDLGFVPLTYACCSVGALMSPDPEIRAQAASFAEYSESLLNLDRLNAPSTSMVQAVLVLAGFNIGSGRIAKGWMLSGLSFRMGQELGFQRDHSHWDVARKSSNTPSVYFNNEHWRKLYWGSFLVDKILSLFLGRPTFMQDNDADVDISEPPPDDPHTWEDWLISHDLGFLETNRTAGPNLASLLQQQVELGRIIHDILATTFVPKRNDKSKARRWTNVLLNKLNARLVAWHEALPNDMRWKKWLTAKDTLLPEICMLHTLYHNTRICLNLPFLVSSIEREPSALDTKQGNEGSRGPNAARMRYLTESAKICKQSSESLVDILHRFRAQHTLVNSPIILVYGAIVATNAILVTLRHQHRNANEPPMRIKDSALPALDTYLQELSVPWALAGEARIKFQRALSTWYRQTPPGTAQPAFSEQWPTSSSQPTTGPAAGTDMRYMDLYPVDPALQASLDQNQYQGQPHGWYQETQHEHMQPQPQPSDAATVTGSSPDVNFESPVPLVWDPMTVLDVEVGLWGTIGGGFPAGIDAGFDASGMAWTEEQPQPTTL